MSQRERSAPQTVVVSRQVRIGKESEFERLSTEMTNAATDFPGHLGATMFRPSSPEDPEYRIIFKFEDENRLSAWLNSNVRKAYLEQIDALLIEPSKFETLPGLATWFTLPGRVSVKPPQKYKMAIVSWIGLFPIVAGIFWLFGKQLESIPLLPRVGLVTALVMVLMTWVAMPRLTKLFAPWLYPGNHKDLR